MSVVTRRLTAAVLFGAVLALGVSCSSNDGPVSPSVPAPSQALDGDGLISLRLLTCSMQPYAVTTTTVGPDGAVIKVGTHQLTIPQGALTIPVTITAEQVPGDANTVRFSPEGLLFLKSAQLTLSYRNCSLVAADKKVVYTDESLRVLSQQPSKDDGNKKTVTGDIRHFSRYAVAW